MVPLSSFGLATSLSLLSLLGSSTARAESADLTARARATSRPPECAVLVGPSKQAFTIWDALRDPNLPKYCDLLALGNAVLDNDPERAKKYALSAERISRGRSGALVLLGRARIRLGEFEDAHRDFVRAEAVDRQSVEAPLTMVDRTVAARKTGHLPYAMEVYRELVPRISLLPKNQERLEVLLEAAHLSMRLHAERGQTSNFQEAIAFLREAREHRLSGTSLDVLLSLALAYDRALLTEQADAVLAEASASGSFTMAEPDYLVSRVEEHALRALYFHKKDREKALREWDRYLENKDLPDAFAKAAKTRRELLKRGNKADRKPR